jgi:hypothetical protein
MTSCYECAGTGECPSCHGTGVGLTQKCIICSGSGACQACNPRGLVAPTVNTPRAELTRQYRWVVYCVTFLLVCFAGLHRMGGLDSKPRSQIKQLTSECDSGSGLSCTELGRMFAKGETVRKDDAVASKLYAKACSLRDAVGCFNLASRAATGQGLPKKPDQAAALYAASCGLNYSEGCLKAAEMYSQGTEGTQQDSKKALELYRLGCVEGNQRSCSASQGQTPSQTAPKNLRSTSTNRYQLPPSKLVFTKPATPTTSVPSLVVDPKRQAELRELAQSADQSSIWTGYPNCNAILNSLPITPTPASLDAVDYVHCGESLEVLSKDNKFYLVRTKRSIFGYVVTSAVSPTP